MVVVSIGFILLCIYLPKGVINAIFRIAHMSNRTYTITGIAPVKNHAQYESDMFRAWVLRANWQYTKTGRDSSRNLSREFIFKQGNLGRALRLAESASFWCSYRFGGRSMRERERPKCWHGPLQKI
jgi:hypothetical protein